MSRTQWNCHPEGTPLALLISAIYNHASLFSRTTFIVWQERLNICLPHMQRFSPVASESKKSIMHRTAWDTTIQVVPFFLLSNSMPFPILARSWQLPSKKDEAWRDNSFLADEIDDVDDNLSSDDDLTAATPSIKCKGLTPFQVHKADGSKGQNGHASIHVVERGETLQMSGINLREPFFIQLAQRLHVVGKTDETSTMWSKPLQIEFGKLRTGINPKGTFALPKIPLDIGDSCSVLIDVSVEGGIRMPICTVYSPCWIMNKTGAKLGYKVKISSLVSVNSRCFSPILSSGNLIFSLIHQLSPKDTILTVAVEGCQLCCIAANLTERCL